MGISPGKVVVPFNLNYKGEIVDIKILENTVTEMLALILRKAIRDPAPFGEWSRDAGYPWAKIRGGSPLHFIIKLTGRVSPGRIEPIMEAIVYVLLIITSLVGLTFIVERGLALRWKRVVPPEIEAAVDACNRAPTMERLKARV